MEIIIKKISEILQSEWCVQTYGIDAIEEFNVLIEHFNSNNEYNYCMPNEVNTKEEHKEYLKVIVFNLLHEFFNHKSDANKYLEAAEQEDLEKEFGEWYFKNAL